MAFKKRSAKRVCIVLCLFVLLLLHGGNLGKIITAKIRQLTKGAIFLSLAKSLMKLNEQYTFLVLAYLIHLHLHIHLHLQQLADTLIQCNLQMCLNNTD